VGEKDFTFINPHLLCDVCRGINQIVDEISKEYPSVCVTSRVGFASNTQLINRYHSGATDSPPERFIASLYHLYSPMEREEEAKNLARIRKRNQKPELTPVSIKSTILVYNWLLHPISVWMPRIADPSQLYHLQRGTGLIEHIFVINMRTLITFSVH